MGRTQVVLRSDLTALVVLEAFRINQNSQGAPRDQRLRHDIFIRRRESIVLLHPNFLLLFVNAARLVRGLA